MKMNRTLNMLGMARRANRVSLGHDAALAELKASKSRLILLSSDASERLCDEFAGECSARRIPCLKTAFTMNELGACMGAKTTAVLSIGDAGFAKRITELISEDN